MKKYFAHLIPFLHLEEVNEANDCPFLLNGHKLKGISNKNVNVVYGLSFIGIDPTSLSVKMSVTN